MLTTSVMLCLLHVDSLSWRILAFLSPFLALGMEKSNYGCQFQLETQDIFIISPLTSCRIGFSRNWKLISRCKFVFSWLKGCAWVLSGFWRFRLACWWKIEKACAGDETDTDGEQTVDWRNLCFYTFCVIWDNFSYVSIKKLKVNEDVILTEKI